MLADEGEVTFEWRVFDAVKITNPDQEIDPSCPLGDLPKAGTMFFRVKVEVLNEGRRPVSVYDMDLLMSNNDATYGQPLESLYLDLGGTADVCVPEIWSPVKTSWQLDYGAIPGGGSRTLVGAFQVGPTDRDVQIEVQEDPYNVSKPTQVIVLVPSGELDSYFN